MEWKDVAWLHLYLQQWRLQGETGRKGHREFVRSNRRKSLELAVAELSQGLIQGTWE